MKRLNGNPTTSVAGGSQTGSPPAVERWLADDPYPRAEVSDWPDPVATGDLSSDLAVARGLIRTAAALRSELAEPAPPLEVELSEDPSLASHQLTALSPLGVFDRYRLLCAASTEVRIALLNELLEEEVEVLRARLALGDDLGDDPIL